MTKNTTTELELTEMIREIFVNDPQHIIAEN